MASNNIRKFKHPKDDEAYGVVAKGKKKSKKKSTNTNRKRLLAKANTITRFRPHGWRTDYTGSFRVGDDGKLIPQMYLHKIQSKKKKKGKGVNT